MNQKAQYSPTDAFLESFLKALERFLDVSGALSRRGVDKGADMG
jgi:hypothetical protein